MRPGTTTMLRTEARLLARDPGTVTMAVVLPIIAAIVLAVLPGTSGPNADLGGISFSELYQPVLVIFTTTVLAVQVMPAILSRYRADGVLRRLRTTPASPGLLLGVVITLVLAISVVVGVLLVGLPAALGVPRPASVPAFALAAVVGTLAFLGLGAVIAALASTPGLATGIGTTLGFVLWFFAGMWVPRTLFPGWLDTIASATPSGAVSAAMLQAAHGGGYDVRHLLIALVWAVVTTGIAVRTFRWE